MDKTISVYICIFLAVLTFAVYLGVLGNDFVNYDDNDYVTDNQHTQSGLRYDSIKWAFTTHHTGNWHPMTWLSLMLDSELFGIRPWGYHLTNLLLHILNVIILFAVLKAMTGAVWRSAFVAAIFAIHPLNVESVAWIAERKNVLSTMFWLLTIGSYWKYSHVKNMKWYLLTLLLFAVGLMSKPMVVTLPFTLLLLDYWPLERLKSLKGWKTFGRLVIEKIPFFVLSVISSIVTFAGQKVEGAVATIDMVPLSMRICNAIVSYGKYIGKMLWPSKLAVIYPFGKIILMWHVIIAALTVIIISVLVIRLSLKHKYLLTGWLWYIGTLVPVIGLVQVGHQAMADRYAYVPMIGLFIIVGWGITEILDKLRYKKILLSFIWGMSLCVLSLLTILQLRYWHNGITILQHTIEVTRNNEKAYYNLGYAYTIAGNFEEAIESFKQSIRIKPDYTAHYGLGVVYVKCGRYQDAIEAFKRSIGINPDYADSHYNLGNVYEKLGRYQEALEAYEQTIRIKPNDAEAHNSAGVMYGRLGRYQEAIEAFKESIRINANYAEAYYNLGLAYDKLGRYQDAIEAFKQAVRVNASYPEAYSGIGAVYGRLGRYQEAIGAFEQAIKINANYAEAHYNLGLVYVDVGNKDGAMKEYGILKKLNSQMAESLLGNINK